MWFPKIPGLPGALKKLIPGQSSSPQVPNQQMWQNYQPPQSPQFGSMSGAPMMNQPQSMGAPMMGGINQSQLGGINPSISALQGMMGGMNPGIGQMQGMSGQMGFGNLMNRNQNTGIAGSMNQPSQTSFGQPNQMGFGIGPSQRKMFGA